MGARGDHAKSLAGCPDEGNCGNTTERWMNVGKTGMERTGSEPVTAFQFIRTNVPDFR
jgi:hypothetical protein